MPRTPRLLILVTLAVLIVGATGSADEWKPAAPNKNNKNKNNSPPAAEPQQGVTTAPPLTWDACQPYGSIYGGTHAPVWMAPDQTCAWYYPWPNRWYATADALWLKRNKTNNRTLSVDDNPNSSSTPIVFETDDLKFDFRAGARLTLGHYIGETTSIEGSFFGFQDWNANTSVRLSRDDLIPYWGNEKPDNPGFQTRDFENAFQHTASYASNIYSTELGLRRWLSPDGSVLLGFRYLNVNEDFVFQSTGNEAGDLGRYAIHTDNNLVGVQIGGKLAKPTPFHCLRVALEGKAGVFVNFHQQNNSLLNASTPRFFDEREVESTGLASLLEFGITATLQLSDHLALRAGYNHIFLTGLALAPDQLDNKPNRINSRTFVNDRGSLYMHGPFVGGELILP